MTEDERNTILLEHMPLVRRVARRVEYRIHGRVPFEDLAQEGYVGLIERRVLENFQPGKYALDGVIAFQSRQCMFDYLRSRRGGQVVKPAGGEHVGQEVELEATLASSQPSPLCLCALQQKWERLSPIERQYLSTPMLPHHHRVPGSTRKEKRAWKLAQMTEEQLALHRAREAERVRKSRQKTAA